MKLPKGIENSGHPKNNKSSSRKRPEELEIDGIYFCPYTPGSVLKKELSKVERLINRGCKTGRILIVERSDPKTSELLCNPKPWKGDWCQKDG